jgi:L-threonylcarbamoyladenylate synthase
MIKAVSDAAIKEAVNLLKHNQCVAIPTETVYGLAANALKDEAIKQIYAIKKRPSFNPLISHFSSLAMAQSYVELEGDALTLAQNFWPGPLTLIVTRNSDCKVSDLVTASLNTIAVRVPSHPTARRIIEGCGFPLAAPSANSSGEVSPTAAAHVAESLGDDAPLIIADGVSQIGLESTVIDCTGERAVILRPGSITQEDCAATLGYDVQIHNGHADNKPKSPGQLLKHYAPQTPVRLKAYDVKDGEALLAFGSTKFMNVKDIASNRIINLSETGDLYEAAANLYSALRTLDKSGASTIAVMDIPAQNIGIAINDRLKRAAEK